MTEKFTKADPPNDPFKDLPIAQDSAFPLPAPDPNALKEPTVVAGSTVRVEILEPRTEEWHLTVVGDSPMAWHRLCLDYDYTPLYLELNNRELQLLLSSDTDPRLSAAFMDELTAVGFTVIRVKHEVRELLKGETALYYEAHAILDGVYRDDRKHSSRDLYRAGRPNATRWYLTWRDAEPLNMPRIEERAVTMTGGSVLKRVEQEIVILDTNLALDKDWLS
jgi:hypothetical protein